MVQEFDMGIFRNPLVCLTGPADLDSSDRVNLRILCMRRNLLVGIPVSKQSQYIPEWSTLV